MDGLSKVRYWCMGWISCLAWIPQAIIKEWLPDLAFWNPPNHPNDFIWYAERVNGRTAMIAVLIIFLCEFLTKTSILELVHVL
jgi:hypothetical protein